MQLIFCTDAEFLHSLTCFCGKPATMGWHTPVDRTSKPKKLSKTDTTAEIEIPPEKRKPQPYGWSCAEHIPKELATHE